MKLQVISSFERSNLNLISICKIKKYDEYENNISIAKKTLSKLSNCSMIINLKIWNLFIKQYSKKKSNRCSHRSILVDKKNWATQWKSCENLESLEGRDEIKGSFFRIGRGWKEEVMDI